MSQLLQIIKGVSVSRIPCQFMAVRLRVCVQRRDRRARCLFQNCNSLLQGRIVDDLLEPCNLLQIVEPMFQLNWNCGLLFSWHYSCSRNFKAASASRIACSWSNFFCLIAISSSAFCCVICISTCAFCSFISTSDVSGCPPSSSEICCCSLWIFSNAFMVLLIASSAYWRICFAFDTTACNAGSPAAYWAVSEMCW